VEQRRATRRQLAVAVFEWIDASYNPHRRHTSIGALSPSPRGRPPSRPARAGRLSRTAATNRALRSPQRRAATAGGINTPDDPSLCGPPPSATPEPSRNAREGHNGFANQYLLMGSRHFVLGGLLTGNPGNRAVQITGTRSRATAEWLRSRSDDQSVKSLAAERY